jgi:hypothetical protein
MEEALARVWTNLVGRLDGPLHLRFLVQPAVALLLGVRAGLRDARRGERPFLHAVLAYPELRRQRLREAWKDVSSVFLVSIALDSAYQLMVHKGVFVLELLLTAAVLALVPYAVVRGPVARLARRSRRRLGSTHAGGRPSLPPVR